MSKELDTWLEQQLVAREIDEIDREKEPVFVRARRDHLRITSVPQGGSLGVRWKSETVAPTVTLDSQTLPDSLHLEVKTAQKVSVVIGQGELPGLTIDGLGTSDPLRVQISSSIGPKSVAHLHLRKGHFDLRNQPAPQILTLENAQIHARQLWQVDRLAVRERVQIDSAINATEVSVWPNSIVALRDKGTWSEVIPEPGCNGLILDGRGQLTLPTQPSLRAIELRNSLVQLGGPSNTRDPMSKMTLSGCGEIAAQCDLLECKFRPVNGQLVLAMSPRVEVLESRGEVTIHAELGAVCVGSKEQPLRLMSVIKAEGAEFQGVDLFGLGLGDLGPLAQTERLAPWLPGSLRTLRERADAMEHGTNQVALRSGRKAHFWSRMSAILETTHAPGNAQSKVRYLAARARRVAAPWGREKILLSCYSAVGYGETILRPTGVLMLLAICATALKLSFGNGPDPALPDTLLGYLLAPLTFFRASTVRPPSSDDTLPTLGLTALSILELALLFFLLSAIRRVTKAE